MWPLSVPFVAVVLIALMAIYVPTVYIRKTNRIIKLCSPNMSGP